MLNPSFADIDRMTVRHPSSRIVFLSSVAIAQCCVGGSANADTANSLSPVTVIGVTALPGSSVPLDRLPGNNQSASAADLASRYTLDTTEFLARKMGGVFTSDAQGNPLQRELQVRGFVASPLLGLPQGLSVYQDGVRINEPFGDTVAWALIPEFAIDGIDLLSGSNALFGLNTLGGALVLHTKNGFTHDGLAGEVVYGSARRLTIESNVGGTTGGENAYFIGASHSEDDGWRDFSPTRATQVFADARRRYAAGETSLSLTYVDTDLIGNGPAPDSLLAVDRRAIFTRPDQTKNKLWLISAGTTYRLGAASRLTARLYERQSDIATLNGDESPYDECTTPLALVCNGDNEIALDQRGNAIAFTSQVDGAALNRSVTEQLGRGVAIQWTTTSPLYGRGSYFAIGANIDRSHGNFQSNTELGAFDATRAAIGSGFLTEDSAVELSAATNSDSVFFSETWSASLRTAITLSGRYFRQSVELRDQIGTALNGNHRYSRFSPSVGVTQQLHNQVNAYLSYAESNRTPSPVELTCANPDDPCRLPNAFLSDPPLRQVIAKTIEIGLRGNWTGGRWHLGAFDTANRDDIIFVSAGALTNEGYFKNVKATERQGVEVLLNGKTAKHFSWSFSYTFLDATFQDDLQIASANHPLAVNGEISVRRGDRLPSTPRHLLKLGFDWTLGDWTAAVDAHYASSQYARGDEANLLTPLSSFVVANAQVRHRLSTSASLTLSVQNIFNRDYATFATLGQSGDVLKTPPTLERFSTPAAPRSMWLSVNIGH